MSDSLKTLMARAKELDAYYGKAKSRHNYLAKSAWLAAKLFSNPEKHGAFEMTTQCAEVFVALLQVAGHYNSGAFLTEILNRLDLMEEKVAREIEREKVKA